MILHFKHTFFKMVCNLYLKHLICLFIISDDGSGDPRSCGLDLLDRVQKRVVSLIGAGHSSDLQALSHRRDVASFSLFYKWDKCSTSGTSVLQVGQVFYKWDKCSTMGNVPLSLRNYQTCHC